MMKTLDIITAVVEDECAILWNNRQELTLEKVKAGIRDGIEKRFYPENLATVGSEIINKIITPLRERPILAPPLGGRQTYPGKKRDASSAPMPRVSEFSNGATNGAVISNNNQTTWQYETMTREQFGIFTHILTDQYRHEKGMKRPLTYEVVSRRLKRAAEYPWLVRVKRSQVEDVINTLNTNKVLSSKDSHDKPFLLEPLSWTNGSPSVKNMSPNQEREFFDAIQSVQILLYYSRKTDTAENISDRLKEGTGGRGGYPGWVVSLTPEDIQIGINKINEKRIPNRKISQGSKIFQGSSFDY